MVDIFRNADAALGVVQEALALDPNRRVIWMQLGVRNDAAARLAEDAGVKVVMNRCPKIEYGRLSSEISWMGVNSRTLSSKRAPLRATVSSGCRCSAKPWPAAATDATPAGGTRHRKS